MAIDPSVAYGGQVDTSDSVGYPYGKARNESVDGDGNGTPFEASWVSDLWGFLQTLLSAVGTAPSGTPDKVGASQYFSAIQTLINKIKTSENTWTLQQHFAQDIDLATNAVMNLRGAGGIFWAEDNPLRTIIVPLRPVSASGWNFVAADSSWGLSTGTAPWITTIGRDLLPSSARIVSVRAACTGNVAVALEANQTRYNLATANAGVQETAISDSFTLSGSPHIFTATAPGVVATSSDWLHDNAETQLRIRVVPGGAGLLSLRWIAIDYYDWMLTNA